MCFRNAQRLPELDGNVVMELLRVDRESRAVNTKPGAHREFAETSALRMLGPYSVKCRDGTRHCVKNGHPLSLNHPWRRASYFEGNGDGARQLPGESCIAARLRSCTEACLLCGGH